jgi:hypothetical protein
MKLPGLTFFSQENPAERSSNREETLGVVERRDQVVRMAAYLVGSINHDHPGVVEEALASPTRPAMEQGNVVSIADAPSAPPERKDITPVAQTALDAAALEETARADNVYRLNLEAQRIAGEGIPVAGGQDVAA